MLILNEMAAALDLPPSDPPPEEMARHLFETGNMREHLVNLEAQGATPSHPSKYGTWTSSGAHCSCKARERDKVEGATQVPYKPGSSVESVNILLPVNMAADVDKALATIKSEKGDIDAYVARELGFECRCVPLSGEISSRTWTLAASITIQGWKDIESANRGSFDVMSTMFWGP